MAGTNCGRPRSAAPRAFFERTDIPGNCSLLSGLRGLRAAKPVIGGAHGGAPEVIHDGKTGYLVQHGDAGQLATSLEALLADPAHGREMGARGRERVEREVRFTIFAKSLKKTLRDL